MGWKLPDSKRSFSRNDVSVEAWSFESVYVNLSSFQSSRCLPANVTLFQMLQEQLGKVSAALEEENSFHTLLSIPRTIPLTMGTTFDMLQQGR